MRQFNEDVQTLTIITIKTVGMSISPRDECREVVISGVFQNIDWRYCVDM
jgi:hypothetical protein